MRTVKAELMTPMELVAWVVANHSYRKFKDCILDPADNRVAVLSVGDDTDEIGEDDEESIRVSRDGFTLLDAFTASHVKQVYDAISDKSKAEWDKQSLLWCVSMTWKVLEKVKQ